MSLLKSVLFLHSRNNGGCDTKIALPLFENQSIVEQPLDLWDLTEKYAKAAATQILTARYLPYVFFFFKFSHRLSTQPACKHIYQLNGEMKLSGNG